MNFKILFLWMLIALLLSSLSVLAQDRCYTVPCDPCTVNDNCKANYCALESYRIYKAAACNSVCLGALNVGIYGTYWACTAWEEEGVFIIPEFGLVPRLVTFLSSLGVPFWLFRRRK